MDPGRAQVVFTEAGLVVVPVNGSRKHLSDLTSLEVDEVKKKGGSSDLAKIGRAYIKAMNATCELEQVLVNLPQIHYSAMRSAQPYASVHSNKAEVVSETRIVPFRAVPLSRASEAEAAEKHQPVTKSAEAGATNSLDLGSFAILLKTIGCGSLEGWLAPLVLLFSSCYGTAKDWWVFRLSAYVFKLVLSFVCLVPVVVGLIFVAYGLGAILYFACHPRDIIHNSFVVADIPKDYARWYM